MSDELNQAFVERLWWIASLEELAPEAVAALAHIEWNDLEPPPSRRGRVVCYEYGGLVGEPFAQVVLTWQPERRVGRVEITPSRLVTMLRADFDAALVEHGAPPGTLGMEPPPAPGLATPFASARMSRLSYEARAARLTVHFENLSLRRAEIDSVAG
jgi:hypothetical protein